MSKKIIERMQSTAVLETIFDYIKNENFKYKLFTYSKSFQKKLNIKLLNYQEIYINKLKIKINSYLYDWNNGKENNFDKNILIKNLQEDLIKYKLDINILQIYIYNYYKKYIEKLKKNNKVEGLYKYEFYDILIDIYSPLFDFLSKTDIFEQIFTIQISLKLIEKFNLKNDYISAFNNLNKSNSKYSSIKFYYKNNKDIDYLKDFQINLQQIKRLEINNEYNIFKTDDISNNNNNDYLLKNLFSFFNIENNLLYLKIDIYSHEIDSIDNNLIENFNNLKLLEFLYLKGFKLNNPFIFRLFNLEYLNLENCENFTFEDNSLLNVKELILYETFIAKPKSLLKLPNIEICEFKKENPIFQKYYLIFDFSSFKTIKNIIMDSLDFIHLKNSCLENIELYSKMEKSKEIEKEMIKNIINIKTLKEIKFELKYIEDKEILDIKNDNTSITKMHIDWKNENKDCILYNLQNKLPNLTYLNIYSYNFNFKKPIIEIKENKSCKINQLDLFLGNSNNIKFYCSSYEDLKDVSFYFMEEIANIKNCFPIFNDKCKVIFKSLISFEFTKFGQNEINLEILQNIYNNLYNMPNLKIFSFRINIKDIKEDLYKKFIKKLFTIKLDELYIDIKQNLNIPREFYTEDEIKKIWPEIKNNNINKIRINKLF